MFEEKTLFILGAGASWYYGYPLGKDLILAINNAISSEHVYVQLTAEQQASIQFEHTQLRNMKFSLHDIANTLENIKLENLSDNDEFAWPNHRSHPPLAMIKMNQIKEFLDLKETLKQFDPVSIDAFLNTHHSHAPAGKAMIIYELLKCEYNSAFGIGYKRKSKSWEPQKSLAEGDNWYSYLLADIMSGCIRPEDIVNNNLDIITFNYDMSLDYILCNKLSNVEMFKENEVAKKYIDDLVMKKIHHVYGTLYNEGCQNVYGQHQSTLSNQNAKTNTIRLVKALNSSSLIKLINERLSSGKEELYKSLIETAKKIIIIGFGFDRDNLNMLGFPTQLNEYNELLKGKELLYMDYDGRMRGLAEQLDYLKHKFKIRVTRSAATRIIDAYQNDFKIRLYSNMEEEY